MISDKIKAKIASLEKVIAIASMDRNEYESIIIYYTGKIEVLEWVLEEIGLEKNEKASL